MDCLFVWAVVYFFEFIRNGFSVIHQTKPRQYSWWYILYWHHSLEMNRSPYCSWETNRSSKWSLRLEKIGYQFKTLLLLRQRSVKSCVELVDLYRIVFFRWKFNVRRVKNIRNVKGTSAIKPTIRPKPTQNPCFPLIISENNQKTKHTQPQCP